MSPNASGKRVLSGATRISQRMQRSPSTTPVASSSPIHPDASHDNAIRACAVCNGLDFSHKGKQAAKQAVRTPYRGSMPRSHT